MSLYPNAGSPWRKAVKELRRHNSTELLKAHRTPKERWGTCCPHDPECEHSILDADQLTAHMDRRISDTEAQDFERNP